MDRVKDNIRWCECMKTMFDGIDVAVSVYWFEGDRQYGYSRPVCYERER